MKYFQPLVNVLLLLSLMLPVCLCSSSMPANRAGSTIKGVVQNSASMPIPGVKVLLRNAKTNFTSGTVTDRSGEFSFKRIPVDGAYSFTFSTVGYETQTLSGYTIKKSVTLSIIVKMNDLGDSREGK